jgi:hypothetical protein
MKDLLTTTTGAAISAVIGGLFLIAIAGVLLADTVKETRRGA